MRYTGSKIGIALVTLIFAVSLLLFGGHAADAGMYLDSAHGDQAAGAGDYGVNRSALGYPEGFCGHCHEQHASIGGSEPAPVDGAPSKFELFYYPSFPGQTDNFCFKCHTNASSLQSGGSITNQLYSERAGGWNTSPANILAAFSYSSPGTSHNLNDISTVLGRSDIKTSLGGEWSSKYTSDSNPCSACHNPHAAQGDPLGNGGGSTAVKNTILANRGWPVSRPSLHSTNNTTWGLWGDGSTEQMNDYASSIGSTYQAPYQYNTTSAYEPAACSGSCNGSELADYVTVCTDCHNSLNTIYSTTLGRNLYKFDWASEKHGGADAVNDGLFGGYTINDLIVPYDESAVLDYVLACTDCHEPHGSANRFLVREGVNGGTAATSVTLLASSNPDNTKDWKSLCIKCHGILLPADYPASPNDFAVQNAAIHHRAYDQEFGASYSYCSYCHEPDAEDMRNCLQCHYHGSTQWPAVPDPVLPAHDYKDGGGTVDKMF